MRCRASGCLRKSMPFSFLNSSRIQSMSRPSQSSPPRWVSPLVALTSEVKATNGDTHLGGDDWDGRLMDWILDEFKKENGMDLRKQPDALQRIKEEAEKAKIAL